MKSDGSSNNIKSLGALRKAKKTKPRSPDLTGHLTIQSHTLEKIVGQYKKSGKSEVPCNIAAWRNTDKNGATYLSVEISPWFVPAEQRRPKSDVFDSLFNDDDE